MAIVTVNDSTLTDIADSIRAKLGVQDTYKPSEMSDAIDSISGGDTPTGTKQISITENGTTTEDVTNYASAEITVAVPVGSDNLPKVISNSGSLGDYTDNSTTDLRTYAFYYYTGITGFSSNSVNTIRGSAFRSCTNLAFVNVPNLTNMNYGGDVFNGCTKLVSAMFPKLNSASGNGNFAGCSKLETVDYGTQGIPQNTFLNCTKLTTLILRKTTVASLGNINAFSGTPFKSGGIGGTIYIPKALYDHLGDGSASDYQSASNWSTIYGYGTITWAKIEGSIYELS